MMKQTFFFPKPRSLIEHGGSLLVGKRRRRRPLSTRTPHHLVLRSDFAYGCRALTRHRPLIARVLAKASKRFQIRIYETGIVSNHIHLAVRGRSRESLQNFFRVVAGHIAQEILRSHPIRNGEKPRAQRPGGAPVRARKLREKENKFWQTRVYTRIVRWGLDFRNVVRYVIRNSLEGQGLLRYAARSQIAGGAPGRIGHDSKYWNSS